MAQVIEQIGAGEGNRTLVFSLEVSRAALAGQDTLEDGHAFGDTEGTCERQILRPILSEDGDGAHPLDGAGSRFGHAGDDADKGGFARTVPPDQSDALGADREGQIAKEDLVFRCLS
jgi:hypothetical protein